MKRVSEIVKDITDKNLQENINKSEGVFFINYSGVSSADMTALRRNLSVSGSRMVVSKNSYFTNSLKKEQKNEAVTSLISGPTALVFIEDDPVKPVKVLTDFLKTHDSVKLQGGYIRERMLEVQDFKVLASIQSREVLYQQIAIACNGPVTKFATSLKQILAKVCYAVQAVREKKEKETQ